MSSNNEVLVIVAGGTILKRQHGNKMEWSVKPEDLLEKASPNTIFNVITAYEGLAANFSLTDIINIATIIMTSKHQSILIILGTDILEEVAFALDYILSTTKKIVISAAMRPYGRDGYDGILNLNNAINFLLNTNNSLKGVFCIINEQIFSGRQIYKFHSTRADAFAAYPGSIGEIVAGEVCLHNLPVKKEDNLCLLDVPNDIITSLRVPILLMHTDTNPNFIKIEVCDGLILSGMGAGSIPDSMRMFLATKHTKRIPIVISTRCTVGPNHADNLYTGSLYKYTSQGFIVSEFTGLNPLQSRLKLQIDIAIARAGLKQSLNYFCLHQR